MSIVREQAKVCLKFQHTMNNKGGHHGLHRKKITGI